MKKLLQGSMVLLGLISLCSCTKVIYNHNQVMQSYRTKEAVVKQFGLPDERKEFNGITEWLYNCDSTSTFTNSNTRVELNGKYNSVNMVYDTVTAHFPTVKQFTTYKNYVKFAFDSHGNVLNYYSHGVNFAQRKKNAPATILLTAGIVVAAIILISSLAIKIDFGNAGLY